MDATKRFSSLAIVAGELLLCDGGIEFTSTTHPLFKVIRLLGYADTAFHLDFRMVVQEAKLQAIPREPVIWLSWGHFFGAKQSPRFRFFDSLQWRLLFVRDRVIKLRQLGLWFCDFPPMVFEQRFEFEQCEVWNNISVAMCCSWLSSKVHYLAVEIDEGYWAWSNSQRQNNYTTLFDLLNNSSHLFLASLSYPFPLFPIPFPYLSVTICFTFLRTFLSLSTFSFHFHPLSNLIHQISSD